MLGLTISAFDRIAEWTVRRALADADIEINGKRAWDLRVRDPRFYLRLVRNPAFQLGETYMDGLWECDAIDELMYRMLISGVAGAHEQSGTFHLRNAWARLRNNQARDRAAEVATAHYDIDTELYAHMLDESMTYTCAVWRDPAGSLGDAQRAKLQLVCDKLGLRPGQTLLDVGCGFGGLAAFAAEHCGVSVVGITNSLEHAAVARARTTGLPIEILHLDYRDLPSLRRRFDHIASIEMIEAVGPRNFETYMTVIERCLADDGRFLLQSFISGASRYVCNEWFDRYIFPNGVSPSFAQLAEASAGNLGAPKHVEDIGDHYPATLLAWDRNLTSSWPKLSRRHDARFRRMWHFYLTCLAGVFRAKDLRLCQIVYTRGAVPL